MISQLDLGDIQGNIVKAYGRKKSPPNESGPRVIFGTLLPGLQGPEVAAGKKNGLADEIRYQTVEDTGLKRTADDQP